MPFESVEPLLWISTILGALSLPFAIWDFRRRLQRFASMQLVDCQVIGHSESDEHGMFYTEYCASFANGSSERFRGDISSSPKKFQVGEQVSAYYSADGEPTFIVNEFYEKWLFTLVLCLSSLFGLLSFPLYAVISKLTGI